MLRLTLGSCVRHRRRLWQKVASPRCATSILHFEFFDWVHRGIASLVPFVLALGPGLVTHTTFANGAAIWLWLSDAWSRSPVGRSWSGRPQRKHDDMPIWPHYVGSVRPCRRLSGQRHNACLILWKTFQPRLPRQEACNRQGRHSRWKLWCPRLRQLVLEQASGAP